MSYYVKRISRNTVLYATLIPFSLFSFQQKSAYIAYTYPNESSIAVSHLITWCPKSSSLEHTPSQGTLAQKNAPSRLETMINPQVHLYRILFLLNALGLSNSAGEKVDCIKWGSKFDVPLRSKNVRKDCSLPDGRPICCAAVFSNSSYVEDGSKPSRGIGYSYQPSSISDLRILNEKISCSVQRTYISSAQEERDLLMSVQLEEMSDPDERLDSLLKHVTSDEMMMNSTKWLTRISMHMQSADTLLNNDVDREFLSRFHMIRSCFDANQIEIKSTRLEWDEWIEPINIAARHPFAFGRCKKARRHFKGLVSVDRSQVDYVLIQSGKALNDANILPGNVK